MLVRLRSGRCFYADPERQPRTGRPRRHGRKLACDDPTTWWAPMAAHHEGHAQYGAVRVRAWADLHAKTEDHPTRGRRRPGPSSAAPWCWSRSSGCRARPGSPSGSGCGGAVPARPDLAVLWRAYVHRCDLEHTYRFCKQTLNWTTPRVRHPEQADRWTWLVLLAYTQLRLARRAIEDRQLPWERPQRPTRRALTPARVRQAFPQLLVALDTPADAPKPCGRSPGRPLGRRSGPAPRYPAIKKAA